MKPKHSREENISVESFENLVKRLADMNHAEFVAENFGVGDNTWKQIMFIVFWLKTYFDESAFLTNEHHTSKGCFFHKLLKHELRIFGQSKVMQLNTAETCTDSNGASEVSTSEAIEHFIWKRSHKYMKACNIIMTKAYNKQQKPDWIEFWSFSKDLDFVLLASTHSKPFSLLKKCYMSPPEAWGCFTQVFIYWG